MDTDERLERLHAAQTALWVQKVNQAIHRGEFCNWVSACHPDRLSCEPDKSPKFRNGGYNLGLRVIFSNGDEWFVRLVQFGSVHEAYADEKVAIEVEALSLIRSRTNIPVPAIYCWGRAEANPLGLGAFIMMEFIPGVSLDQILRECPEKRIIRDDVDDATMEQIYRQMARIQFELFKINFGTLGSLPTPMTGFPAPARPLTFKAHDILQCGGIDCFGDRSLGFSNTADLFQAAFAQDIQQLVEQPSSVVGPNDARAKLSAFDSLRNLLSGFVHPDYSSGPYKLTRLTIYDSTFDKEAPAILERFNRYFDLYTHVLKQEEAAMPDYEAKQLSSLVEWCRESGALWLHMLLSAGFNYHTSLPFSQLIAHIGADKFKKASTIADTPETGSKIQDMVARLKVYEAACDRLGQLEDDEKAGKITKEDFVREVAKLL